MRLHISMIAVAAVAATPALAQIEEQTLRYAVHVPQNNVVSDSDTFFAEKIEELTDRRVKVDIYWNRALGKQAEMLPLIAGMKLV